MVINNNRITFKKISKDTITFMMTIAKMTYQQLKICFLHNTTSQTLEILCSLSALHNKRNILTR